MSSSSTFGDFEELDALDTEPPDVEQVARKLLELRRRLEKPDLPRWDYLTKRERDATLAVVEALLGWLRRQGGIR